MKTKKTPPPSSSNERAKAVFEANVKRLQSKMRTRMRRKGGKPILRVNEFGR